METITSTSASTVAASGPNAAAQSGDAAAISSDFETFLKMLTVQVENQDPLNPVDSTDYATQLATFSSVEQQVLTNDLLKQMGDLLAGNGIEQMGSWLGMEVLARAPVVFDGAPVTIRPDYAQGAESADLLVRDSNGDLIDRVPIDMTQDTMVWSGQDDNGALHPSATYSFEIESFIGDTPVDVYAALTYNPITEVRSDGETLLLRLPDGSELPSSLVSGMRPPAE